MKRALPLAVAFAFTGIAATASCSRNESSSAGAKPPDRSATSPPVVSPTARTDEAADRGDRKSASPDGVVLASAAAPAARAPSTPVDRSAVYAWRASGATGDALVDRIAPPEGFTRIEQAKGTFGAWLRTLPLMPAGTRVLSYSGEEIRSGTHENVAAVVDVDIGTADLQQCADSVIRMHAEWTWSSGKRDQSYRAASGLAMPLSRWLRGERLVPEGNKLEWQATGNKSPDDHATLRRYLDAVFTWANTVSLARQAQPVAPADVAPGDFFVLPGNPGHAVLVLDLARASDGRMVALLGQGFMPAQSFHVLRPNASTTWFSLDPASDVKTPFWRPFPWSSLRRL